jgi:2-haloacid dehalogenase
LKNNLKINTAIIFDFGGVLIDWDPRHLYRKLAGGDGAAVERFFEEVGFFAWNLEQDRGRPFKIAVTELCARFPRYAEWIRAYDERWEESIGGFIQPTVDILCKLKQKGHPLYALSNWSEEKFQLVRAKYEFFSWFDAILVSGEARMVKPDPGIFTLFLEKIGRKAGECLFIDDSEANIKVANQLGFETICYLSPEQLETELHRLQLL